MPRLGMNMLLWSGDVSDASYAETFAMLRDAGFEAIEVPLFDPDPRKAEQIGTRLRDLGLTPLGVSARSGEESPISPDPAVRRHAVEATKLEIEACAALGASILCGPLAAPLGVFSGSGPTPEERQRAVETLRSASDHAERHGVTLAVEWLNRFELYLVNCAADAASLVREVDHPNCRLMYDTFHAHIEEKDPHEALESCADVLVHFHASENDRGTPGLGQVDWDRTFDALADIGYDGWVVIEAFGNALPELAAATKTWRRTFDTREALARDGARFLQAKLELLRAV
jgi:D-psicose/D-tagatose/L-ribulose 3-epimerase